MAGRPRVNVGKKRVKLSTTVAPTTDQWLGDVWDKHRISKGDMFDRLVKRYGNEILAEQIEAWKERNQRTQELMERRNVWPFRD